MRGAIYLLAAIVSVFLVVGFIEGVSDTVLMAIACGVGGVACVAALIWSKS